MSVAPGPTLPAPYPTVAGTVDEMVAPDGSVRDHWATVAAALTDQPDLDHRAAEAARLLAEDGVTYHVTAGERPGPRPWVTDPVPLMVGADEWATLERGVVQRSLLLDRVLQDLYGDRRLLSEGLLPPEVVYGHPGFLRTCDQIRLPGPHQLFLAAADLARDADGRHVVLSDRTQAPSGVGYALENRVVVSRVLPGLHRPAHVQQQLLRDPGGHPPLPGALCSGGRSRARHCSAQGWSTPSRCRGSCQRIEPRRSSSPTHTKSR